MRLAEPHQSCGAAEDGIGGELVERGELPVHELAQRQQILGRIAAQGQFGKDDQLVCRT